MHTVYHLFNHLYEVQKIDINMNNEVKIDRQTSRCKSFYGVENMYSTLVSDRLYSNYKLPAYSLSNGLHLSNATTKIAGFWPNQITSNSLNSTEWDGDLEHISIPFSWTSMNIVCILGAFDICAHL